MISHDHEKCVAQPTFQVFTPHNRSLEMLHCDATPIKTLLQSYDDLFNAETIL